MSGDRAGRGVWASVLRGLNVAGARPVSMAALRGVYEGLGFRNVRTYVQSGNVVFQGPPDERDALEARIQAALGETLGLPDVDVFLRARDELERLVRANPFLAIESDPTKLHATFHGPPTREPPAPVSGRDTFVLGDGAVYVHCPDGYGRTKLNNAWFERALGTRATTRNWRTVTALLDLVGG
ncbi:MAG: hypothetical protein AMXMBFR64_22910 [Myxococcales bacterium]